MRRNKALVSAFLMASLAVTESCSSSTVLAFAVSNIPAGTNTLRVTAKIDGKNYNVEPVSLVGSSSTATLFSITIPWKYSNSLIDVSIIATGKQCDLASWNGTTAAIEPVTYSIAAPLERLRDDQMAQDFFTIKAIKANDVWTAGAGGAFGHWDGCYWKNVDIKPEGIDNIFTKLYYHDKIGLWATGSDGLIYKYDDNLKTWTAKKGARDLFPTPTGASSFEWIRSTIWADISYLNGTAGDFILIGTNYHSAAVSSKNQCLAVRATLDASKPEGYSFSKIASVCSTPIVAAPQVGSPTAPSGGWPTCSSGCFVPARVMSMPDGLIISGDVRLPSPATAPNNQYGAYLKYDNTSFSSPSLARYVVQSITNPNQETSGTAMNVWGSSTKEFWLANNRLFHVSDAEIQKAPEENLSSFYEDKGSSGYRINSIWGANSSDFWITVLSGNRLSRVHHITTAAAGTQTILAKDVDQKRFSAPIGSLPYIVLDGTSDKDVWFAGYSGVRAYYNGKDFTIYK